jgi:hypothetical protein
VTGCIDGEIQNPLKRRNEEGENDKKEKGKQCPLRVLDVRTEAIITSPTFGGIGSFALFPKRPSLNG